MAHSENTTAVFCNLLAHPIQSKVDWRMALAEVMFPTAINNFTTNNFFICNPKIASKLFFERYSGGGHVSSESRENNAKHSSDVNRVEDKLKVIKQETRFKKSFVLYSINYKGPELLVLEGRHGVGFFNEDNLINLTLKLKLDRHRKRNFFAGNQKDYREQKQPIVKESPSSFTAATKHSKHKNH